MPRKAHPLADRFWAHVKRGAPDVCWEWQSKARTDGGYGVFQMGRGIGTERAHRVAWTLTHGLIPEGLWVLHHCDNPPCCNPGHLYLGTSAENGRDMSQRGRTHNQRITQCPAGHRYTKANTRVDGSGRRRCRKCLAVQRREHYLRTGH